MTMRYKNDLIWVDFQNADEVVFDPSGYIEVSGDSSTYSIDMVSNVGYTPTDWSKLCVNGTGSKVILMKSTDGYILKSDKLNNIILSGNNDKNSSVYRFSTDHEKVFIYEVDANTMGVKVDKDKDGTYETVLDNTINDIKGDINMDGTINIADLVSLQKKLVKKENFNVIQYTLADYNNDGKTNVFDTILLRRFLNFSIFLITYQGQAATPCLCFASGSKSKNKKKHIADFIFSNVLECNIIFLYLLIIENL